MAKDSTNDTMHPKFSSVQKGAFCTLFWEVARYEHNKENTVNTSDTIVKYNRNNKVIFAILIF